MSGGQQKAILKEFQTVDKAGSDMAVFSLYRSGLNPVFV